MRKIRKVGGGVRGGARSRRGCGKGIEVGGSGEEGEGGYKGETGWDAGWRLVEGEGGG